MFNFCDFIQDFLFTTNYHLHQIMRTYEVDVFQIISREKSVDSQGIPS